MMRHTIPLKPHNISIHFIVATVYIFCLFTFFVGIAIVFNIAIFNPITCHGFKTFYSKMLNNFFLLFFNTKTHIQ